MKKVLHLSNTPVAGSAGVTSDLLNRYSSWQSNIYTKIKAIKIGDFSHDYRNNIEVKELQKYIDDADLIHFHNCDVNEFKQYNFNNKKFVIQLHSEVRIKAHLLKNYPNNCITIAQKHAVLCEKHFYKIPYVPNLISIFDEEYMPIYNGDKNKVVIVYAPTSKAKVDDYKDTCIGKGYDETLEILNKIQKDYPDIVEVKIFNEAKKEDVLRAKKDADIVIDECVTGGYHRNSLEGLSLGCITIGYIMPEVEKIIKEITGCSNIPWDNTQIEMLEIRLRYWIELKNKKPHEFINICKLNRQWMEQYWNPSTMTTHYINLYNNIIDNKENAWEGLTVSGNLQKVREIRNNSYREFEKDINKEFYTKDLLKGNNRPMLIVGNGKSLSKFNMDSFIKYYNPLISVCNYFHLNNINIIPDYWCMVDTGVYNDVLPNIPEQTKLIGHVPNKYFDFNNQRMWLHRNIDEINKETIFNYEIERAYTVVLPMLVMAVIMKCNPIFTIGIDLDIIKTGNNYSYSKKQDKYFNDKFRPFTFNQFAIIKEFKLLNEEAKIKGKVIYNLDKETKVVTMFNEWKGIY